ncbi:MAG: hypothetical protein COZ12_01730 [Deltaproteobacteria bacterium CG_4_10_14_3_um_filter_60_8]|nr:MAG: hypothetical protein COX17_07635 [Deltaproteobacteria bacterium CG23_combo_of_CG06-09_8_20_14_all_60_8]PIY23757.1 MAG: hypothetical protein COZ12_01730 [Deltaproteobacteria bacterium CG_4_10_14_3_um_filter_60_8]
MRPVPAGVAVVWCMSHEEKRAGEGGAPTPAATEILALHVSPDLVRAFQRCKWIIIAETGQDQVEVMNEMVRDFLVKHGC